MKYLIFSTLLLCAALWSCEQDNFDQTDSETETFTPSVTEIPYYKWAVGIDTLPVPIDSSWIGGVIEEDMGRVVGFSNIGPANAPASIYLEYSMEFSLPGGYPFMEGNYDLTKLTHRHYQFNYTTNTWDTIIDKEWIGDQIDGTIEIIETVEVFDPIYNLYVWEHTGFASATLTNDDGTSHDFTSAFNHLR